MGLAHLIYVSRPFGFDTAMLNGILVTSRANNVRDDITGALICRADVYLQLLEGPVAAIEAAYVRIARDDRHQEVTRLFAGKIDYRMFPKWAMRDDPARTWMWTQTAVEEGAIVRASEAEILDVFARVAASPPSAPD